MLILQQSHNSVACDVTVELRAQPHMLTAPVFINHTLVEKHPLALLQVFNIWDIWLEIS